MRAVQPCDFCSSCVSSNFFVSSQPNTSPPPPLLVHRVWFASSANWRWWVLKQVSIRVNFFDFGSYIASWRPLRVTGKSFAEGCDEPSLQNDGLSGGRMTEVNQTRPLPSNMGLCMLAWLSQMASLPHYGVGCSGSPGPGVL